MKIILTQFLILISLFISSCGGSSEFDRINAYFKSRHELSLEGKNVSVFVLTSQGCPTCSKSLALIMEEKVHDLDKTIFLITNTNMVTFYSSELANPNILIDENISFVEEAKGLFNTSAVYYINENKIDTVIELSASMLEEQLNYIKSH